MTCSVSNGTLNPTIPFSPLQSYHMMPCKSVLFQTWSKRDLGLGLEMSRDRNLKVLVLVLNTKVLVLVLMPKVSVLVLKLDLDLGIVFRQLNKFGIRMLILKCNITRNMT